MRDLLYKPSYEYKFYKSITKALIFKFNYNNDSKERLILCNYFISNSYKSRLKVLFISKESID
jgi:hypothetical protein